MQFNNIIKLFHSVLKCIPGLKEYSNNQEYNKNSELSKIKVWN